MITGQRDGQHHVSNLIVNLSPIPGSFPIHLPSDAFIRHGVDPSRSRVVSIQLLPPTGIGGIVQNHGKMVLGFWCGNSRSPRRSRRDFVQDPILITSTSFLLCYARTINVAYIASKTATLSDPRAGCAGIGLSHVQLLKCRRKTPSSHTYVPKIAVVLDIQTGTIGTVECIP